MTTTYGLASAVMLADAVAAALIGWMIAYGRRAKREGERLAAAENAPATGQAIAAVR